MQNLVPKLLQPRISRLIPSRLPRLIMHPAIKLDNQATFMTIKVDNIAINWNLPAKLQLPPILQQNPGSLLGACIVASHLACYVTRVR
jgi:hypothetical protein